MNDQQLEALRWRYARVPLPGRKQIRADMAELLDMLAEARRVGRLVSLNIVTREAGMLRAGETFEGLGGDIGRINEHLGQCMLAEYSEQPGLWALDPHLLVRAHRVPRIAAWEMRRAKMERVWRHGAIQALPGATGEARP